MRLMLAVLVAAFPLAASAGDFDADLTSVSRAYGTLDTIRVDNEGVGSWSVANQAGASAGAVEIEGVRFSLDISADFEAAHPSAFTETGAFGVGVGVEVANFEAFSADVGTFSANFATVDEKGLANADMSMEALGRATADGDFEN